MSDPMLPAPARVLSRKIENYNTVTLELEMVDAPARPFLPGQFNMLYLFGAGEVPISMSGDAAKPARIVHTIRSVGMVTEGLCALKRGEMVGLRGPFGTNWPLETARGRDVIIIVGGIGLAPLRPVIYSLLAHRKEYDRIAILYGCRAPREIIFPRELARWRARLDLNVEVTVDRGEADWRGDVGLVTTLINRVDFNAAKTIAMVCGPELMMRFTARELCARGVASENIYVSMERNMKCAVGFCGHCQFGAAFVCKDGPVFPYERVKDLLTIREV